MAVGLAVGVPCAQAQGATASDARLGGDTARTRFVVDLSKEVDFRVFTLADPYRVIVDLPDVEFRLPSGAGSKGMGLVSAYRYGLFAPGKSRIVLDIAEPALVSQAFVRAAADGQPARLVVDLVKTDRPTYLARMRAASGQPPASDRASAPAQRPRADDGKRVVVLDPGHGGIDPGAVARSGLTEKEVVFAFAKVLQAKLRASGKYEVLLTREIDTFMSLGDRVEFARRNGAELFISIHADSIPGRFANEVSGATVYTLSEQASDEEAKALAAKENRADIIAGVELPAESDEVTSILIELAQRETKNLSITFAEAVLSKLRTEELISRKPHRYAGFRVLKAPDVPSVLLELGYLTNPEDEKKLKSEAWRQQVAQAVTKAVDSYFADRVARMPF